MKNLTDFIYNSNITNESLLFEDIFNNDYETLEDVYEALFDKIYSIDEGFFGAIGNKLKDWGSKLAQGGAKAAEKGEELDKNIEEKVKKASEAAKKAIKSAKEKAGNAWDKVKNSYKSIVTSVDKAVLDNKAVIEQLCKTLNMHADEVEGLLAKVILQTISESEEFGKDYANWSTKGDTKKILGLVVTIMGVKLAKDNKVESKTILTLLSGAGVK
jgi:hypothetical protein